MRTYANKYLEYGTKKRKAPSHLASLNAARKLETQENKENIQPTNTLISTYNISDNSAPFIPADRNTSVSTFVPSTAAVVSLSQYKLVQRQAKVAVERAEKAEAQSKTYKAKYYNANRRAARAVTLRVKASEEAAELRRLSEERHRKATQALAEAERSHTRSTADLQNEISNLRREASAIKEQVRTYQDEVRLLRVRVDRAPGMQERRVQKALWKARRIRLTDGGIYTPEARDLMRTLRAHGVPAATVGKAIRSFATAFGLDCRETPSARTVQRAVREGGLASKAQVVEELLDSEGRFYI